MANSIPVNNVKHAFEFPMKRTQTGMWDRLPKIFYVLLKFFLVIILNENISEHNKTINLFDKVNELVLRIYISVTGYLCVKQISDKQTHDFFFFKLYIRVRINQSISWIHKVRKLSTS